VGGFKEELWASDFEWLEIPVCNPNPPPELWQGWSFIPLPYQLFLFTLLLGAFLTPANHPEGLDTLREDA